MPTWWGPRVEGGCAPEAMPGLPPEALLGLPLCSSAAALQGGAEGTGKQRSCVGQFLPTSGEGLE